MKKPFQDIFTPRCMVEELIDHIPLKDGDTILEPTCGDGNMVEVILDQADNSTITAIEIQLGHLLNLQNRFKNRDDTMITQAEVISVFDEFF